MSKLGRVARDALARGVSDKALAQVPALRDACLWLRQYQITYPEAREPTHWETRKGILGKDFPEGMEVIELLTEDIIEAQRNRSMALEMGSLANFFASVSVSCNVQWGRQHRVVGFDKLVGSVSMYTDKSEEHHMVGFGQSVWFGSCVS